MFALLNHRIDTVSPCCESKSNIFWGYQLLQLEHLNCFDFNLHGIGWNITKRAKRITVMDAVGIERRESREAVATDVLQYPRCYSTRGGTVHVRKREAEDRWLGL
jgi:hypothetical protein